MILNDRESMARFIVDKLDHLKDLNITIVAVPPKGIALAKIVADQLNVELEIAKIRPGISEKHQNLSPEWNSHLQEMNELMMALFKLFSNKTKVDYQGKPVVIIDEGTITEDKLVAVIDQVRENNAGKVILIIPGLTSYNANKINSIADELYTFSIFNDNDHVQLKDIPAKTSVEQYLKRWWNDQDEFSQLNLVYN